MWNGFNIISKAFRLQRNIILMEKTWKSWEYFQEWTAYRKESERAWKTQSRRSQKNQ